MPNSCKEYTATVMEALERDGIRASVLRSCTPWMPRCHVSAIAYVDGQALVIDNGALLFGRRIPTLEEVLLQRGRFSVESAAWLRAKLQKQEKSPPPFGSGLAGSPD